MTEQLVDREVIARLCAASLDLIERTILVSDHEVILYANPSTAVLLHAESATDLIGIRTEELSHPDSRAAAKMRRELVAELGEELTELPTKVIARDGSSFVGVTDMYPIAFGEQTAFLYTGRIASDGQGAVGWLPASADRASRPDLFEAALEAIPDIVLIHDVERILFANAACRRYLGAHAPEDIEGRPVDVIVHPDAYAAGRERRQLLLDGGQPIKGIPLKVVSLDNQAKHVTCDAYPLTIEGSVVAAAIIAPATAR